MDAALVLVCLARLERVRRLSAGWYAAARTKGDAFRCRHRRPGEVVQKRNDATAEFFDFSEGVLLAAPIDDGQCQVTRDVNGIGREPP